VPSIFPETGVWKTMGIVGSPSKPASAFPSAPARYLATRSARCTAL
jgi:hypothetical protein